MIENRKYLLSVNLQSHLQVIRSHSTFSFIIRLQSDMKRNAFGYAMHFLSVAIQQT